MSGKREAIVVEREPVEGEYRCSECGHGENLYACAYAVVSGSLLPNGDVAQDDVSQTDLAEDSIDCREHPAPGAVLERWFDGHWTRLVDCTHTETDRWGEEVRCFDGWLKRRSYENGRTCPDCKGRGQKWVALASLPSSGSGRGTDG